METANGKTIKIADLVDDEPAKRDKVSASLNRQMVSIMARMAATRMAITLALIRLLGNFKLKSTV